MSDTVTIRNKTDGVREIDGVGVCEPGGTIEVPAELANGIPPKGEKGSPDYWPGVSGFLAQETVWELAHGKSQTRPKNTDDKPSGEED